MFKFTTAGAAGVPNSFWYPPLSTMERRLLSPDSALASDYFDQFCNASTLKSIMALHRKLCDTLNLRPTTFPQFYPKLRGKLRSWRAQALWTKFDKRASHKCYARGTACNGTKVLIIGAGPCGLRAAIEAQLLGAKVVVVEKRDRISRNNVLHLWPFVIHDLRSLGAKKFFGKFCAGSIDHISIRQLQVILMKVALLLGVEIHVGVSFESLLPPPEDQDCRVGWRAAVSPADHAVSQYEFDVLIGADGKRNTLEGFGRKEFRGKLAIAVTANFLNRHTEAEARVEEISGVAFIFNQKFFKDLYQATGIDLENIVYYKDDTHYFVMTAKKHSLLDKGVIISDQADTARLLSPDNVDRDALMEYAREAADFSTQYQLPALEFAVNHYGQPDVAMFDFTSMYAAENATKIIEKRGHRLLTMLVGDSLLEPFWPTGSGCARGFLSSLDSCWAVRAWGSGTVSPLEVAAERESIYRLLAQTTPENLSKDFNAYTLEPHTRYPNLNLRAVLPIQARNLIDTDNPTTLEVSVTAELVPSKRRRKESQVHPDTLLQWLKRQVALYDTVKVENVTTSFRDGMALGAIVHRYRPELIDFNALKPEMAAINNQLIFDLLQRELGISPVMSGAELAASPSPDQLSMLSYLSQVYDAFRGEIPHSRHKLYDELDEAVIALPTRRTPVQRTSRTNRLNHHQPQKRASLEKEQAATELPRAMGRVPRKRRSHDKDTPESVRRREQLDADREERAHRRRMFRHISTQNFVRSMQMLQASRHNEQAVTEREEDPALAVYRQHAPHFQTRVQELEQKFIYRSPTADRDIRGDGKRPGPDENFSGRIKELEAKFKGTAPAEKKPRDLLRSIGKIERTDWNMAVIEKKIEENRFGRSKGKTEKVPKWNREKFADKFSAVERKLRAKSNKEDSEKFADIDDTLRRIDRKIREGSVLDQAGPRGANKVSAMAEQLATKLEPAAEQTAVPIQKSSSRTAVILPQQGVSENCHFCGKRVYLMERLSAEGRFFHRGCFRCEYCGTSLRPNNYAFDRDGKYGSRFVCTQHFGFFGCSKGARARRKSEDLRAVAAAETELMNAGSKSPSPAISKTPTAATTHPRVTDHSDGRNTVGVTPERVEFENLAGSEDDLSEARPASGLAEMDEEAWTDHNFGASCADDDSSSGEDDDTSSDSEDDAEAFEEALDKPLSVEETRQLAASWQRRHSHRSSSGQPQSLQLAKEGSEISDDESSEGEWSCERDEIEDEDSSTATEGDAVARELLRQEQRLRERALRRRRRSQGSDTEVASDCTSTDSDSEEEEEDAEEEEEENLATEIETDSEFELDNSLPTIIIDSERHTCQVKSVGVKGNLGGTAQRSTPAANKMTPTRKPQQKPSLPPPEMTPAILKHRPNHFPGLDLTLRQKEQLNRTHSTEGIASKMSLELKKRYLLGGDSGAFNKNVQKSGSASALDSRFRSLVDQISEQQKLLQPAASPSPTMQAFLEGQTKLSPSKTAPSPLLTSMSTSSILQGNRAESGSKLPKVPSSFVHICGKRDILMQSPPEIKITPEIDDEATPVVETKDILTELDAKEELKRDENEKESEKISDLEKEKCEEDITPSVEVKELIELTEEIPVETNIIDPDYRPRSPAHETSIIVPDISMWKDKKEIAAEGDEKSDESSEESSESSSEYDDSVEELPKITNVPQLEITDSEGVKIQTAEDVSPDKPDEYVLETELSDWAAEENSVGDFDEFTVDTKNITFRKRKGPIGNPTLAFADDDILSESLEDNVPKIDIMIVTETKSEVKINEDDEKDEMCPTIDVMVITESITTAGTTQQQQTKKDELLMTPIGSAIQDIDFMDSGDDDDHSDIGKNSTSSSPEKNIIHSETKNIPLIEGYIQLNEELLSNQETIIPANDSSTTESISKSSDDFGTTPDTELENLVLVEAINSKLAKTSDEESLLLVDTDTTTSDVTTLVLNNVNQNNICNQTSRPFIDPSYEAHVKRLQGRISPFSNAKDSIDIRKSRRSSTTSSSNTPSPSHSAKDDPPKSNSNTSSVRSTNNVTTQQDNASLQNGPHPQYDSMNNTINLESKISLKDVKTHENVKLKEESPSLKIIPTTPSTSRKLEEISRERSKQKDLIADLVISKLGTNSLERKRSLSGGPGIRKRLSSRSPTGSPRCSLFGPPVPPPPLPVEDEPSPPVPPPPINFPSRTNEISSSIPKSTAAKPPLSPSKKDNIIKSIHIEADDDDVFVTPRKIEKPKERPISVFAFYKAPESKTRLPETPLTHPEAFSCPDIRRALFVEEGRTKARQEARARARLLSDQELGLSPEDTATLSALRDKARRRFNQENIETPVAPPRMKKKSDSSKFSPNEDTSIEETKTDPIVTKRNKKPKDRERRRSLIQAMSEFFSRKKDASPSKESSMKSPTAKFHVMNPEDVPPPLPPPPQGYQGCQSSGRDSITAEESPSEGEDSKGPGSNSLEGSSLRRSARNAKRVARQAQLKRLRMAHELQRQLEQLEEKQRVLEERGVQLEKALRGEDAFASSASGGEVALLQEWFELMRERSELRRYERELGVRAQELELQDRHAKLQSELRERMALDDASKSSEEVAEEGKILAEMLEVVERRDTLIALLEEDRQRYAEEDKDIEAQMLAKGLRLTPLRKESHV